MIEKELSPAMKYYYRNREECIERCRKYYKKNKEYYREKHKEWWHKNREQNIIKNHQRYLKNKEEIKIQTKKYYYEKRNEARKILGNECTFCRGIENLVFHKKDGQPHYTNAFFLVLKNPNDFTLNCTKCHKGVHFCMNQLGLDWEIINTCKGGLLSL